MLEGLFIILFSVECCCLILDGVLVAHIFISPQQLVDCGWESELVLLFVVEFDVKGIRDDCLTISENVVQQ